VEWQLLYMVVETFRQGAAPVYERAAEQGRLLPVGLAYLDSWVDQRLKRCFQLMQTDDVRLLHEWTALERPRRVRDCAGDQLCPSYRAHARTTLKHGLAQVAQRASVAGRFFRLASCGPADANAGSPGLLVRRILG
jgi:hypothetical protein